MVNYWCYVFSTCLCSVRLPTRTKGLARYPRTSLALEVPNQSRGSRTPSRARNGSLIGPLFKHPNESPQMASSSAGPNDSWTPDQQTRTKVNMPSQKVFACVLPFKSFGQPWHPWSRASGHATIECPQVMAHVLGVLFSSQKLDPMNSAKSNKIYIYIYYML